MKNENVSWPLNQLCKDLERRFQERRVREPTALSRNNLFSPAEDLSVLPAQWNNVFHVKDNAGDIGTS